MKKRETTVKLPSPVSEGNVIYSLVKKAKPNDVKAADYAKIDFSRCFM